MIEESAREYGVDSSSQSAINAPPGFEGAHTPQSNSQKRKKTVDMGPASSKSLDVPPGFESLINSEGGGASIHLEVDDSNPTNAMPCRERKANKQINVQSDKRVTRSQTKQRKESVLRRQSNTTKCTSGKERKEISPSGGDSAKTTDSMLKLANEALAIGEVLGIRVISKRENALKRITSSLKSKRT